MKLLAFLLSLLLLSPPVSSQEYPGGHFEATDDSENTINWLYFHCTKVRTSLKCDVFQTLMAAGADVSTCEVLSHYSSRTFTYNRRTGVWTSSDTPTGPCARANVGTLSADADAKNFWRYTEKKTTTNPNGLLPNADSCRQLPEVTIHYTSRSEQTPLPCSSIQHMLN